MCSDNPVGAENQQERLITTGWVIGFVDGEGCFSIGCFSIGFVRQPDRCRRRGYKAEYQVFHRFVVTQGARSAGSLDELHSFFGAGRIYVNRRQDNHKEDLHQYIVGRRDELSECIVPFFREHPLRTSKQEDFEKFALCLGKITAGEHLSTAGLSRSRRSPRR